MAAKNNNLFHLSQKDWSEGAYSEKMRSLKDRVTVWFSCGATSAVAAKLAILRYKDVYPVDILYCDTGGEHPSNFTFLLQCEFWLGQPIIILKNKKYKDHFDVMEKRRFIKSRHGAPCTTELKRQLRMANSDPVTEIQIFGYDSGERKRVDRFRAQNEDVYLETPLLVEGISKASCQAILLEAGIDLPEMYLPQKSGAAYDHTNCIGCPKGGMGYWNKIRVDFPDAFEKMAQLEEEIGHTVLRKNGEPLPLRELDPAAGRNKPIPPIACDLMCYEFLDALADSE